MSQSFSICCLKSYGDLVIIHNVLKKFDFDPVKIQLLLGVHLKELNLLLNSNIPALYIGLDSNLVDVPDCYNIKKSGIIAAVRSLSNIHSEMNYIKRDSNSFFILDSMSLRERFIFRGFNTISISEKSKNIYLGYIELFKNLLQKKNSKQPLNSSGTKIGIFPMSRVAAKALPERLIDKIFSHLPLGQFDCHINIFEDYGKVLNPSLPVRYMKKNFSTLIEVMSEYDFIISSDSLTAHLAEFLDKPVFVFTPKPNSYWLPLSAYSNCYWSEFAFDEVNLTRFLRI